MNKCDVDISQYFSEFSPTPKQLKKLTKLLKGVHKSLEVDQGVSVIEATLIFAPGNISKLCPPSLSLLRRCQNRMWAFKIQLDAKYSPFHKQTYIELFDLLLSLNFIEEATPRQKLQGSTNLDDLRRMLRLKGLSEKGKKNDLLDRLVGNLSATDLENLIKGIILFCTTKTGDQALKTITELQSRVEKAFHSAVIGTADYFEETINSEQNLPPGVYYDDGEVHITEDDILAIFSTPKIPVPLANTRKCVILSFDFIHSIVTKIESNGDGWLTIFTKDDSDADFVQCSFTESYPEQQWYFDAAGDIQSLSILGFVEDKDCPSPMKWVPRDKVIPTIFETLVKAFKVEPGTKIWVDYDIPSK